MWLLRHLQRVSTGTVFASVIARRADTCADRGNHQVVNAVLAGKGNYGFNAANDTYGDMIEMGILDPTKVTRTALQNAASVASLMLTTEAMVAEAPKEEAPGMPGGMGGGMGG